MKILLDRRDSDSSRPAAVAQPQSLKLRGVVDRIDEKPFGARKRVFVTVGDLFAAFQVSSAREYGRFKTLGDERNVAVFPQAKLMENRENMKVLVNAVSAKSGGTATYIRNLAASLEALGTGHEFFFCVSTAIEKAIRRESGSIKVLGTDIAQQPSWKRFIWDQLVLRRIAKREGADLLVSSSDFGMLFPPCKQLLMIRNPLFFSQLYLQRILPLKSLKFQLDFFIRRWLIAFSARFSDLVVTASKSMMEDVKGFIRLKDRKAAVNPFGVPRGKFPGKGRERTEAFGGAGERRKFRLLYVSEYSDYKNLTTLLRTVLILSEKGLTDFEVVTTADPGQFPEVEVSSREEDKALASNPCVAPFFRFTGSVPYEGIHELYALSDLFVFPSLAESFGHPLVEAMASGLPVLASDIPLCREICGEAAHYFNPLDPKELAGKILHLRDDPVLRRELSELGRARAKTCFNWHDHVRRFMEMIGQVAAGRLGTS